MVWNRTLAPPIELRDGRLLCTLADVRALMSSLPARHSQNSHWEYACGLLGAAAHGQRAALNNAIAQVEQALRQGQGWSASR